MKKIFVTGAAGFIGSNLVDELLLNGSSVLGLDNFDPFYDIEIKKSNIRDAYSNPNYTFVEGDILEKKLLEKLFKQNKIDLVIHLAAKAGVRPSIENASQYYDTNVNGTLNLLEVMRKEGVSKLIFASSSSVYGNNKKIPFSETDNVDFPISPYAASKKAGELICHAFHHLYSMDIFCLRFFTVYGRRQRPEMAINKFVRKLIVGEEITLFGDGSTARDYTYIDDIINGIMSSIKNLKGYQVLNIGESTTIKLKELIELLEDIVGVKAKLKHLPMQAGDVDITFADIDKAKRIIGYDPSTSLKEGLTNFVQWYKSNLVD